MRTTLQCIPCFVRQMHDALEGIDPGEGDAEAVMREVLALLSRLDWSVPPPVIARIADTQDGPRDDGRRRNGEGYLE